MIDLKEELCFILTKSNLLRYKIYNSFSHKVETLLLLGSYPGDLFVSLIRFWTGLNVDRWVAGR